MLHAIISVNGAAAFSTVAGSNLLLLLLLFSLSLRSLSLSLTLSIYSLLIYENHQMINYLHFSSE